MGVSQIPFTAIAEYARIYDIEDFNEFLYLMRRMDNKLIGLSDGKNRDKVT